MGIADRLAIVSDPMVQSGQLLKCLGEDHGVFLGFGALIDAFAVSQSYIRLPESILVDDGS